jgi:hypothetical protein
MKPTLSLLIGCILSSIFFLTSSFHNSTVCESPTLFKLASSSICPPFNIANTSIADTFKTPSIISKSDDDQIFLKVEIEASIDTSIWRQYLQARLYSFLDTGASIPVGNYTVNVRFVVEVDGRISSPKAMNNPGYGLDKACSDAIREGPRWKPGEIFEGVVRSYHTQPITFLIEPEPCVNDTIPMLLVSL